MTCMDEIIGRHNAPSVHDGHGGDAEQHTPACEFLPALHGCGRRALAVLHARLDTEPHHADELAALHALEAETSAALATGS
jgi:hypothetical protein